MVYFTNSYYRLHSALEGETEGTMPKLDIAVIPIRRETRRSDQEIADLAFTLWLARGFRHGSPEADLSTALRMLRGQTTAGLFVVPKRKATLAPLLVLRRH